MTARVAALTLLTLIAFASNSILCRMALSEGSIDAATFTAVRLLSGALSLLIVALLLKRRAPWNGGGSWLSGALLFGYAAAFSFAYLNLTAGTGGLILFASVQFTMIGIGIYKGERPSALEWTGLVLAHAGLLVLVAPGLSAPPIFAAILMAISGASWGVYSLRGKRAKDPTLATGDNFIRALPFAGLVALVALPRLHASPSGLLLATASGAVTSGLGYVLWYWLLPILSATRAAISQLAVPAIVAIAGVTLLGEHIDLRFVVSSSLMLGGVAMAVLGPRREGANLPNRNTMEA